MNHEARERFESVLHLDGNNTSAAFGLAKTCLALARIADSEGKSSQAYNFISDGIKLLKERYSDKSTHNISILKCIGDLFSFGYSLPASVFATESFTLKDLFYAQYSFVCEGQVYYEGVLKAIPRSALEEDDKPFMVAAARCDLVRQYI